MGYRFRRGLIPTILGVLSGLLFWWWNCLPHPYFDVDHSTVVLSRDGQLLGARLSEDEQWRFPPGDSIPLKFKNALLAFEDKRFYQHIGVDPLALVRAIRDNLEHGKVVSGGSTITMQTIRLMRKDPPRNLFEKWKEAWMALRLEWECSKEEILQLYVAHAPFGGNVVGLEAASWRYFYRPSYKLSEAESASLAVLPNAPSMILPGFNEDAFKAKRDALLRRMKKKGILDSLQLKVSLLEPLPGKPYDLPMYGYHLVSYLRSEGPGRTYRTTIDHRIQDLVSGIASRYSNEYSRNGIHNIAILVSDVESGNVLSYVGNAPGKFDHEGHVDMIRARRSSGSILKPFLYASLYDEGKLAPKTLVPDIPVTLNGFYPENFDKDYRGALPAGEALSRSLNIPSVLLLKEYGVEKFLRRLHDLGFTTLDRSADNYGLSLILGGGEVTLWDLGGAYSEITRIVQRYSESSGKYFHGDLHGLSLFPASHDSIFSLQPYGIGAGGLFLALKDLQEVSKPTEMRGWETFGSGRISWKTGTSFGFRDAWAVGTDGEIAVAVWVGNADGEGRPGLIGSRTAGPVMFEVFRSLHRGNTIMVPQNDLLPQLLCSESGYLKGQDCPKADTVYLPPRAVNMGTCPWHRTIFVDPAKNVRYTGSCSMIPEEAVQRSWFDLPPSMAYYYERSHPTDPLPPLGDNCPPEERPMEMIYPKDLEQIALPLDRDGIRSQAIFEAAHRVDGVRIFWYVDGKYLGSTVGSHRMPIAEIPGTHSLILVDTDGNELRVPFKVLEIRDQSSSSS